MTVLYRHPRIWTGDCQVPWATGLLTDGEQVLAAGSADELSAHTAPVRVVDLPGALVIPGLHDAHIHTASLATDLANLDLSGTTSQQEALAAIRERVAATESGGWVFVGGWNPNAWDGADVPHRSILDAVSGDRHVVLTSIDGHTMWANSEALRASGSGGGPDPLGGTIERDEAGRPTGILREGATMALQMFQAGVGVGAAGLDPLLEECQERLLSLGLTSITDIDGEETRAAYMRIHERGRLAMRVTKSIPMEWLESVIRQGLATGQGDDWMRIGPVKLFSDGALSSHTSHMSHGFHGDAHNHGMARLDVDQLTGLTRLAVRAGIAVATHAIGDQANHEVLDAYERVLTETPTPLRLRIEHAQHLQPGDVARFARLGVIPSLQPAHCIGDLDLVDELLDGHDLVSYGWRSLLDAGAVPAFGSDAPFAGDAQAKEPNPMTGLYAAVTRTRVDGTPAGGWQPHERLTMTEALRAHTHGSAYANGDEARKGTLTPGKLADFVALDTDLLDEQLLAHEPGRIHQARALATIVGSEIRWQAS